MSKIKIVALNQKAKEIIKLKRKLPLRSRMALKVVGFYEEIVNEEPFTILADYKNIHTNKELALNLAIDSIMKDFKRNELKKDVDYTIEMVAD